MTPNHILVVDDDPTMQALLQAMIEDAGFPCVVSENGEDALKLFSDKGSDIFAVLLDRHLPDRDGLEVANRVLSSELGAMTPVIMQSGSSRPKEIRNAIEAGVFHYLTKPFSSEVLQTVLSMAKGQFMLREVLCARLDMDYPSSDLLGSASFEFKTSEDVGVLSITLSTFFPEPLRVFPGIYALLINAVEHGNEGLGYEAKTKLIRDNKYMKNIEKIHSKKSKNIEVQFFRKDGRYSIRVTDNGKGFDWKNWSAFKQERDSFTHGYGIIKALNAFDEVKYNTAGNQVMASVLES